MECDTCGRYRPSPEISALRDAGGRIAMVCARCRRLTLHSRAPRFGPALPMPAALTPAPNR